jgi:Ca-activated chloride channel homolog
MPQATKQSRPFLSAKLRLFLFLLILVPAVYAQVSLPPPPPIPPPPGSTDQGHIIKQSVDLVVLHVTVTNTRGEFVPGLAQSSFRVFEDKIEQKISVFSRDDIPVTMGLVVDNSGSMREKRAQVNAAALAFVNSSNPQDEAFVVNFNDEYYLDTEGDFTSSTKELNEALSRIDSRGSTALYDAVIGSLTHIKKGHKDKRVLLVITDGDDDASTKSLAETMKAAQESNATIYAIGVFSDDDRVHQKAMVRRSKKELAELSDVTGGVAYFPETLDEVGPVCEQVARDIRNQYSVGYYPSNTALDGSFRTIRVDVAPPKGESKLTIRTRTGYYSRRESAANSKDSHTKGAAGN